MQFIINIKKHHVYVISIILILFGGLIFVQGYGTSDPPTFGHNSREIDILDDAGNKKNLKTYIDDLVRVESDTVTHGDRISPPTGYTKSDCQLIVSIEDSHVDPDYTDNWGDSGTWIDNNYGGSQAFYDTNTWDVTCQYGMNFWPTNADPTWKDAECRYIMICSKQ